MTFKTCIDLTVLSTQYRGREVGVSPGLYSSSSSSSPAVFREGSVVLLGDENLNAGTMLVAKKPR